MTHDRPTSAADREQYSAARSYAIPFSEVWATALTAVGQLRGWSVRERNSQAGAVQVETADLFGRRPLAAELRLSLDEMGMTRLEMRMSESRRFLLVDEARPRVRRLLGKVDQLLRVGSRG